ncbi:MAG TPA: glycosyltransferase, partial [Candidatus Saccharimonadales bacterium]|nr:glycosyltransferase [Candidatus Saccharimonadales bacterium]
AAFLLLCLPVLGSLIPFRSERAAPARTRLTLRRTGHRRLVYVTRTLAWYRLPVFQAIQRRSVDVHIVVAGGPVPGVPDASERAASQGLSIHRCGGGPGWRSDVVETCERIAPDVLLIEHGARVDFAWTLLMTRRLPGVKRVLWTHGIESRELYSRLPNTGTPGRWLQLAMADGILCYHPDTIEALARRFPGKPIAAAPNSTDGGPILEARRELLTAGRAAVRRARGLQAPYYLAALGRMMPNKLLHRIPRILTRVRERIPDVGLLFLGDGPQRRRILSASVAQGLVEGRDFHLLGDVREPRDLTAWLLCSDLVVNPGYMGLTATDALFAGVPVVLAHAGLRGPYHSPEWRYLRDSVGGIFARDRSDRAFAEAILDHLRRPAEERRAIQEACTLHAEERLGIDPMVRGILGFLEEIALEPELRAEASLA